MEIGKDIQCEIANVNGITVNLFGSLKVKLHLTERLLWVKTWFLCHDKATSQGEGKHLIRNISNETSKCVIRYLQIQCILSLLDNSSYSF